MSYPAEPEREKAGNTNRNPNGSNSLEQHFIPRALLNFGNNSGLPIIIKL